MKNAKPATENTGLVPLSDFQSMFWLANLYKPKTKKFNVVTRKRILGKLDPDALNFAFEMLLKKQKVLSYQILKSKPFKVQREALAFKFVEIDLTHLPVEQQETELLASMDMIISYYPWRKDAPFLIARVFYLSDERTEIQLCMPHVIADDSSGDIIFKDLSGFYLAYFQAPSERNFTPIAQYKDYIYEEAETLNKHIDRDINYWENYFANTIFFPFSHDVIVKNIDELKLPYSTYLALPEETIQRLKLICAENKINILHALSAAAGLALEKHIDQVKYKNRRIFFNVIRSTRNDERYDRTVGCFVRLDAYKMEVNSGKSLLELASNLQRASIANAIYQGCAGLVKVVCINRMYWRKHFVSNYLIKIFATLYAFAFPASKMNARILKMYGRMCFFGRDKHFLININVWGNFVSTPERDLFGSKQKALPLYQYDLIVVNNVLDICFMRDDNNKAYLVISGNLKPQFKEELGKAMMRVLASVSAPTKV